MTKAKPKVQFLIKKQNKLFLVNKAVVESYSPTEVFSLAVEAKLEQRRQLMEDAYKGDHFVQNIRVVDGLEKTLNKFELMFPSLKEHLILLDTNTYHDRVGKS